MKLVFATNNKHKLQEVKDIVGDKFEILSLNDIDCHDDIPETADTGPSAVRKTSRIGSAALPAALPLLFHKHAVRCFSRITVC